MTLTSIRYGKHALSPTTRTGTLKTPPAGYIGKHRKPETKVKRIGAAVVAVLTLASCGDHPIPEHGTITDAEYTPAWVQIIPGVPPMCSGNPPVCSAGTPMQVIPWPDSWHLTVTDLKNKDWSGTMDVTQDVYDRCNLGELWPECSKVDSGDVRP